jgi:N-acetylglutamate synthase-like GNAT family acetyltransferase
MSCEEVCNIIVEYFNEIRLDNFNLKKVKIKQATKKDAFSINSLHKLSAYLLCKEHYTIDQLDICLTHRTPELYYSTIDNKQIYVAEYNRRIIGFLNVKKGEISQLFVHPDYINKGVGKELLNFLNKSQLQGK